MSSALDKLYDKGVTVSGKCLHPETRAQVSFQFDALAMVNPMGAAGALSGASVSPSDFNYEVCIQRRQWTLDASPSKGMVITFEDGVCVTVNDWSDDDFHYCLNCKRRVENK